MSDYHDVVVCRSSVKHINIVVQHIKFSGIASAMDILFIYCLYSYIGLVRITTEQYYHDKTDILS